MKDEDNKFIDDLKNKYNNINIEKEGIFIMKKSIENAKKDLRRKTLRNLGMGFVAGLTVFIALPNLSPEIAMAMSKVPVINGLVDIVTLNKYSDENSNINVQLPVAQGDENEALNVLNKNTDEYIKELVTSFKNEFNPGDKKSLDVRYEVLNDNTNLFTLKINGTETMASGYEFSKIYNVDKSSGKILEIKDVFKENSDYIKAISENIKTQMKEQMAVDENISYFIDTDVPESNFSEINENQKFYFNDKNELVIVFDEYEVAPGYMGSVSFTIPNTVIKNILK